jgi:nucleotide-binding universal stress UspA family protein
MTGIFGKILIATDGSEKNQPAVRKGLEIARDSGSGVQAVYVINMAPYPPSQTEFFSDEVYSALKNEGERAVARVRQMAQELEVETHVLSGSPAHIISEFAAKNNVDLIVVGYQGRTGLDRLLLGSVSERILRLAECMVLVVKK